MPADFGMQRLMDSRRQLKCLQTLMGILNGLLCDGHLSDSEILFLKTWLSENREFAGEYPINIVYRKVNEVLIDNTVTDEERQHLTTVLKDISGGNFIETGAALPTHIASVFDDDPHVIFDGNLFVFTGDFTFGTRKECCRAVESRGGFFKDHITLDTNYLVVGDRASPDWIVENFGRKIQKAAEMASSGQYEISIIREVDWVMALS